MPLYSRSQYFQGLDSIRGLAVGAILISHFYRSSSLCRLGWVGVDTFFVLSGFLITHILLRNKKTEQNYFANFYIRRVLRILPLYFVFLLGFFLFIQVFHIELKFKYYIQNAVYFLTLSQNWLFALKGFPAEYYLNHTWSLAVEEQFYILWPFVLYSVPTRHLKKSLWVAILIILAGRIFLWNLHPNQPEIYYCNTFTRIDSICFGCLLAIRDKALSTSLRLILSIILMIAITAGILWFHDTTYENPFFATIGYSLLAALNYLLLESFIEGRYQWLKKNKILNYLGKISYCVYLIHVPVFLLVDYKIVDYLKFHNTWIVSAMSLILTILLSIVSYYLLESPFTRLKNYFPMGKAA